jgi:transcriptional regulator with XRE-family HTH domain
MANDRAQDRPELLVVLGKRLRRARERQGLSQDQLARNVGVGQSTISRIEDGGQTTTAVLAEVARKLGYSLTVRKGVAA